MIKYLIVGLGNIGPEYHETRHNIGFMTVEALARINNAPPFIDGRYGFTTSFSVKGRQLILLKPSTFMNLSGFAVRYWMQKENIPLENVLIVVDDLALPFGTLRLKGKGSDAGHNGLKHIASTLPRTVRICTISKTDTMSVRLLTSRYSACWKSTVLPLTRVHGGISPNRAFWFPTVLSIPWWKPENN